MRAFLLVLFAFSLLRSDPQPTYTESGCVMLSTDKTSPIGLDQPWGGATDAPNSTFIRLE